jgi:hypothetical protein
MGRATNHGPQKERGEPRTPFLIVSSVSGNDDVVGEGWELERKR